MVREERMASKREGERALRSECSVWRQRDLPDCLVCEIERERVGVQQKEK